jgi:hypothetical protein
MCLLLSAQLCVEGVRMQKPSPTHQSGYSSIDLHLSFTSAFEFAMEIRPCM